MKCFSIRRAAAMAGVIGLAAAMSLSAAADAQPQLRLTPASGPPTALVQANGNGFQKGEVVTLLFDDAQVATAIARGPRGKVRASFSVPQAATPGAHDVTAQGATSGINVTATFLVRTDWAQLCFDAGRSCFNPYENVLGPGNVGQMTVAWAARAGADGTTSPAYGDGSIFVGSPDGVHALDPATGQELWHFSAATGPVSSPAVIKGFNPQPDPPGMVAVTSTDGNLYVLNAPDGRLLWSVGIGDPGLLPPLVIPPPEPHRVVVAAGATLFAFDALGNRLWATVLGGIVTKATALLVQPPEPDKVLVSAGNTLFAVDLADGAVLWSVSPSRSLLGAPSVEFPEGIGDPGLLVGDQAGMLYSVNPDDGSIEASFALPGAIAGSAATIDPNLFVPSIFAADEAGNVTALDHTGAFSSVWQVNLGAGISGSPVVANGVLYVGTKAGPEPHLFGLDVSTGAVLFDAPLTGESLSAPMVADGMVVVGISSGDVVKYR